MTATYTLHAHNSARHVGNPVHDPEAARRLGYPGALVPGTDVYGYLTRAAMQHWPQDWLNHGSASCRLQHPVFDEDLCTVVAIPKGQDQLEVTLEVAGQTKASAWFQRAHGQPQPALEHFPVLPLPIERPPANTTSLAQGVVLGTLHCDTDATTAGAYLLAQRETLQAYARHGWLHPGYLLRQCNFLLSRNVKLDAWMHVGSEIQHYAPALVGAPLSLRGRVTANYEKKGHRFVELDILQLCNTTEVCSRVRHIAIYQPRRS